MARRAASIERLSSVAVNAHIGAMGNIKPLHDGGGLYLRRFDSGNWFWYLRATSPVSGKQTWTAIHLGIRYPHTTLSVARTEARTMRELLSKGSDVTKPRQQAIDQQRAEIAEVEEANRRAVTLNQVFVQWR